jgi:ABC-type multidrug transport system ATPase subunit
MSNDNNSKIRRNSSSFLNISIGSGVQLDASNLSYNVTVNNVQRIFLKKVNFHLDPGDMCALMGPSGAGKR